MSAYSISAFCIAAYLIGAIPFSWLFVRALKGMDLRTVGSGNVGSTNAMRVLGVRWGLVVQALDILKGWLPVFVAAKLPVLAGETVPVASIEYATLAIGACAVVGHVFPVYLRFRGGKGVNTSLGVFLALAPKATLVALGIGLLVLAATRYVSLCSITGAVVFPFAVLHFYPSRAEIAVVAGAVGVLVTFLHRANIKRLVAGTESRLGKRIEVSGPSGTTTIRQ
ncbi:glycerol-3-phosphate 1-O-acyltransferase PlsY [Candidatus Sumerlaeota bacterium]|nr:glycerol-3-phosphate 1-O-acyltransferase PlsY [Candidatus Sumerlaeota bacterium]